MATATHASHLSLLHLHRAFGECGDANHADGRRTAHRYASGIGGYGQHNHHAQHSTQP